MKKNNKVKKMSFFSVKRFFSFSLFATLFLIFILDILSVKAPNFQNLSKLGLIVWTFSYFLVFLFVVYSFFYLLKIACQKKIFITFGTIIIFLILLLVNLDKSSSVSHEATQEVACILNQLEKGQGYTDTCFLGYPARQFILMAVPSMLFGRSFINLHIGGALYFIFGLILFSYGAIIFLGEKRGNDIFVAFVLSLLLHIRFFTHFLFVYEQSIFPLSMGLALVGLFILYIRNRKAYLLGLIGIYIYYLIYTYTPALAMYGLQFVVGVFLLFNRKIIKINQRMIILFILIISALSFLISISLRKDVNILSKQSNIETSFNYVNDLTEGIKHIIFQDRGIPLSTEPLNVIFILLIFLSLTFVLGKKSFFLSLWIIATVIVSIISRGYSYYGIDFRLHRMMVVYPVFLGLILYLYHLYKVRFIVKSKVLLLIFLFFLTYGLVYHNDLISTRDSDIGLSRSADFSKWLVDREKDATNQNIILYFVISDVSRHASIKDRLIYFYPKIQVKFVDKNCQIEVNSSDKILLFTDEKQLICDKSQIIGGFIYVDKYLFKTDSPISMYRYNN